MEHDLRTVPRFALRGSSGSSRLSARAGGCARLMPRGPFSRATSDREIAAESVPEHKEVWWLVVEEVLLLLKAVCGFVGALVVALRRARRPERFARHWHGVKLLVPLREWPSRRTCHLPCGRISALATSHPPLCKRLLRLPASLRCALWVGAHAAHRQPHRAQCCRGGRLH